MKAFRQITFRFEYQFFWSYALVVCILSIFILISPVLAQSRKTDTIEPEVQIHVQKEYDENGNLVRIDSSRTCCWNGKIFSFERQDSIFQELEDNLGSLFHRNHVSPFRSFGIPPGPPLHRFWEWHEADSSVTSFFDKFADEDFYNHYFNNEMLDYSERLKQYQKEHQQLIFKFFGPSWQNEEKNLQIEPNMNFPYRLQNEKKSSKV